MSALRFGLEATITWYVVLWDDGRHVTPRGEVFRSAFLADQAMRRHRGARLRQIQTSGA